MSNPQDLVIICHECYQHGHTAPNCNLSLRDRKRVLINYENLTPAEKSILPTASYERVKALMSSSQPTAVIDVTKGTPETVISNEPKNE